MMLIRTRFSFSRSATMVTGPLKLTVKPREIPLSARSNCKFIDTVPEEKHCIHLLEIERHPFQIQFGKKKKLIDHFVQVIRFDR